MSGFFCDMEDRSEYYPVLFMEGSGFRIALTEIVFWGGVIKGYYTWNYPFDLNVLQIIFKE